MVHKRGEGFCKVRTEKPLRTDLSSVSERSSTRAHVRDSEHIQKTWQSCLRQAHWPHIMDTITLCQHPEPDFRLLDLGCRHAGNRSVEHEQEHEHGATHAFNEKCAVQPSRQQRCVEYDTIRGRIQVVCARARKERNHTHNMPEKHQMFARPNRTLKIIGTAREESKSA